MVPEQAGVSRCLGEAAGTGRLSRALSPVRLGPRTGDPGLWSCTVTCVCVSLLRMFETYCPGHFPGHRAAFTVHARLNPQVSLVSWLEGCALSLHS